MRGRKKNLRYQWKFFRILVKKGRMKVWREVVANNAIKTPLSKEKKLPSATALRRGGGALYFVAVKKKR